MNIPEFIANGGSGICVCGKWFWILDRRRLDLYYVYFFHEGVRHKHKISYQLAAEVTMAKAMYLCYQDHFNQLWRDVHGYIPPVPNWWKASMGDF